MNYFASLHTVLLAFVCLTTLADGKGGSGGGGGRGGGGGFGGRGLGGFRGGRSFGNRKGYLLVSGAAVGAAAGHVAYSSVGRGHRFHTNPVENPAFMSGGGGKGEEAEYKTQESTYYSRRESLGMNAFGILGVILGIIGAGTLAWYCYMVGVPLWKDRQRRNHNRLEGHPLQETPSTATPSP